METVFSTIWKDWSGWKDNFVQNAHFLQVIVGNEHHIGKCESQSKVLDFWLKIVNWFCGMKWISQNLWKLLIFGHSSKFSVFSTELMKRQQIFTPLWEKKNIKKIEFDLSHLLLIFSCADIFREWIGLRFLFLSVKGLTSFLKTISHTTDLGYKRLSVRSISTVL